MMADAWGLPDGVRAAIRYHHVLSDKVREQLTSREVQMAEVVSYANLLAHGTKFGGLTFGAKLAYDDSQRPLGILSDQDVRQIVRLAENQYNNVVKMMGLE
jgi:HD-like signal output (HDOD) protein